MDPYQQKPREFAAEMLECHIIKNELHPHDRLPSERDLCKMYGLNRMTLRSGIHKMISEGLLYNKAGSGTYVAEPKLHRQLFGLQSLTEYARVNHLSIESKLISFITKESNKKISNKLKCMLGSKVYELVRLRMVNRIPLTIETVYLPVYRFPKLMEYDFSKLSLYQVLEQRYDVYVQVGEETLGVTYLNAMEADLLNLEENSPAFFVQSETYDTQKIPVEYLVSISRSDIFYYTNSLSIEEDVSHEQKE